MNTLITILCGAEAVDCSKPSENPLESGYIDLGCASSGTGEAWSDQSTGPTYGGGTRYDREESPFMTKILSKHDREN